MSDKQPVYYRALITQDHLRRWKLGMFQSFHHIEPPEWWDIWHSRGSIDVGDYPLESVLGVFSNSAREAFVKLIQDKPSQASWTHEERRSVSELAGVCAFETPEAAWKYGLIEGEEDWRLFVEIAGQPICGAPEEKGVVVKVTGSVSPLMSAETFRTLHGL